MYLAMTRTTDNRDTAEHDRTRSHEVQALRAEVRKLREECERLRDMLSRTRMLDRLSR